MNDFLNKYGYTLIQPIAQDGSSRSYARVAKGSHSAILMHAPENTPGHQIVDFIRIAEWLNSIGLNAPDIYEAEGLYLLLEDFGDTSFKQAIEQGTDVSQLYELAHEVLTTLSMAECPLALPDYYESNVHKKRRWIIDYYLPTQREVDDVEAVAQEYLNVWEGVERSLPPCPQGFLHIDFHVENLMWLPDQAGLKRCGILDFQGGMIGPKPYDLGNLLEDMRFDVPAEIRAQILSHYDEEFRAWYRVLATQFHCRLMGQIIWWDQEQGKPRYRQYLPRLQNYLVEALKDPLLQPLDEFFRKINLALTE